MNADASVEILLVEDNPQDLELAQRALHKAKLTNRIQVARDGVEALEFIFCEGAHAARKIEDTPKVILLDIKLPKVDGLDVLKRVKSDPRTSSIPIVVLTSSKEQNDVVETYQLGVNSYIVKPVNFESFATAVQQLGDVLAGPEPAAKTDGVAAGSLVRFRTKRCARAAAPMD